MIVQSSEVNMTSTHEKSETRTFSSTSSIQLGALGEYGEQSLPSGKSGAEQFNQLVSQFLGGSLSMGTDSDESEQDQPNSSLLIMTKDGFKFRTAEDTQDDVNHQLMTSIKMFKQLLEALALQQGKTLNDNNIAVDEELPAVTPKNDDNSGTQNAGITVQLSLKTTETVEEYERLSFNSAGIIETLDGKKISFDLDMSMEREYSYTSTSESTQSVTFKDPLVINFPGNAADLTDEKYAFDIDGDGNEEMISYFKQGAMLALDKNNDGKINDGTELFGALSGNGFADLAAYDEDGNNYIDEGDSIFSELKLWNKRADQDSLTSLSSMDIGAIYLGASDTSFDLKGENNQFNGQVKASSYYLTESGKAGYIQQVDMVV